MRLIAIPLVFALLGLPACASSQPTTAPSVAPASAPAAIDKLPHVQVDVKAKQIRVDCQMLGIDTPLEFFCVLNGTNEHESVLRTAARPSHIHFALLMLGAEPGEPVRYSEAAKKWFPPHGPPLNISVEFQKDGKTITLPANRLMRSVHDKKPQPSHPWIFAGSRVMPDGNYAADVTGYVVSVVNFDLSLVDIPELASNANETLEWEIDKSIAPPAGTAVTMIFQPAGEADSTPATVPDVIEIPKATTQPASSDSHIESDADTDAQLAAMRQRWQQAITPHRNELRDAAQAHYQVITQLRREQQKLIDQADRIQRLIDELEKQYQEMTVPRPSSTIP